MSDLLGSALTCALKGWRVVPLHHVNPDGACSCQRRRNCDRAGKHPRIQQWDERATTEATTISQWWERWPQANVGVVTGAKSGVIVLDVDNGELGEESLAELENLYGRLPEALAHRTPGDAAKGKAPGRQLWFAHPGGRVKNSNGELGKYLDVKGDDGLVVVPPSIRPDGRYEWEEGAEDPAAMPDPWPAVVRDDRPAGPEAAAGQGGTTALGAKALEDETAQVAEAPEGRRNDQLNRSAFKLGQLITAGELDLDEARGALLMAAVWAGLPTDEAEATIRSGLAGGQRNPRQPADEDQPEAEVQAEDDQQQPAPNRFRAGALSFHQVISRPLPEYLVDGLVVVHTVAVLFGRASVGKSFCALDWSLSAATGRDWLGRRVKPGAVLYVASEGADGLGLRLQAWAQEHGGQVPPADAFEVYPVPINLRDAAEVAELVAYVAERGFLLTVVDTLNRSIGGGNENAPDTMGPAFEAVDQIRRAHDHSTVLVVHHANEEGRVRGHKSWEGNSQTVIAARSTGGMLQLSTDPERGGKQKDGPPTCFDLQLRPVVLAGGGSSCVLQRPEATFLINSLADEPSNRGAWLALLRQFRERGLAVTGEEAAKFCATRGLAGRSFRDMVNALVSADTISKEGRGKQATYTLLEP
jgi:hypothetical protein